MPPRYRPSAAFKGHVGARIRYYRQKAGLNQTSLARKAKVNQGYLSEIERGRRNPSPGSIKALAVALDVPPAVLIGPGPDHDAPQPLLTRDLPLFATVPQDSPAKAGQQLEMFPVLLHLWSPDRYVLRLSMDSMEPTLKPGDLVLVDYRPDVNPAHVQGRICACLLDNKPTLKRVFVERRDDSRLIILRGDNPDVALDVVDDSRTFSIQGVVTHLVDRAL